MDLPTYTSIWRIEKRLYKLYDFRLPMPLPIGQVTVFVAIAVPYVVLLQLLGLGLNHTLIWLYLLPPGLATWLLTRPVLESKRLPELIRSQLRYLTEPRVLCRMAPLSEGDVLLVTARVWRPRAGRRGPAADQTEGDLGPAPEFAQAAAPPATNATHASPAAVSWQAAASPAAVTSRAPVTSRVPVTSRGLTSRAAVTSRAPAASRPAVTVVTAGPGDSQPPSVERALAGPSARRGDRRAGRVTVVPGGDRPGKPGLLQRDRARAQLPVGLPARIVVLGCTVGAGQTVTALLTSEALASLRSGEVAALDLNPGPASLAVRALARPALSQADMLAKSRLVIVPRTPGNGEPGSVAVQTASPGERQYDPAADAAALAAAGDRYELVLADPPSAAVPRLLAIADQLVLVAPASTAAPGAVAMTFEWLEAHGRGELSGGAIMVLNGVSRRSLAAVEQAERVCAGRCRAIVRVPWDDQLRNDGAQPAPQQALGVQPGQHWSGLLTPATAAAYTALAGLVVTALADRGGGAAPPESAPPGQVRR